MKRYASILMLIVVVFVLSGCTFLGVRLPSWPVKPSPTATPTVAPAATVASPTATAAATATPSPAASPTSKPTATSKPTSTPAPTDTPTATPTPTPAVEVLRDMNLRSGPGTVYRVAGHAKKGSTLPVVARHGDWYQVGKGKWIYGGEEFVKANAGAKSAPKAKEIPPTPTPRPTPKPTATPKPKSNLPSMQDVVVLGPDTKFPVRARVFRGWGYEIVDKSKKWDVVMYRDVLGYVLHKATHPDGTPLVDWKKYTNGVRFTIMDPLDNGHCKDPVWHVPEWASEAPIQIGNWGDECSHWRLYGAASGAHGELISYGCSWFYHNPKECFFAIHFGGKDLTDIIINSFRDTFSIYWDEYWDHAASPYTAFGHVQHIGDQWYWKNPFLRIVPAAP